MADLKVTRFVLDGKTFVIPAAAQGQNGLMSGTDFVKLSGIAAGAQVNVLEGVKVNGTAVAIASKIVNLLIAAGSANGTISVQGVDVAVKGLAALAYKANVSKTDLDTALAAEINDHTSQLTTLGGKIDTLNGTGAGSVKKAIDDAFNDFSTKVSDDGVVNSFKELIDWAATHGSDAAKLAASISNLEAILAGFGGEGESATVKEAIDDVMGRLDLSSYYTKTEINTELAKKVNVKTGYDLSKNDFTDELKAKLVGIDESATANTNSYDEATETLTLTGFSAG